MADLLPSSPDPSAGDGGELRVVGVDSDDADDLLAAIQSETARDLLAALYDDPATPSELADDLDTSIQNVRYHLERLGDADLVEVADTVYSEKGREMNVYAPSAKPLVVVAGGEDDAPGLETALSQLLGGLGVLGLASVAVQRIFGGDSALFDLSWSGGDAAPATTSEDHSLHGPSGGDTPGSAPSGEDTSAGTPGGEDYPVSAPGDDVATGSDPSGTNLTDAETVLDGARTTVEESVEVGGDAARTVAEDAATTAAEATPTVAETTTVADAAAGATGGLPPGLLFFAGGAVVLLALGVAWYLRSR